ncbi:hypothetical protein KSS87_009702 [Heliosperma pusillum]|nr:hypothetical protein KSS87_009702 [Heliosperma pusillum]
MEDMSDWELVNDEGFVYKRKKRTPISSSIPVAVAVAVADPAVELKETRKRRRIALVKLKDKYQHELVLWQHLSNSLISIPNHTLNHPSIINQQQHHHHHPTIHSLPSHSSLFLSHLLSQVEAQEAIIRDFSQLCEVAESLCSVHEEKAKQQFIDLPVWRSPRELMTSLCED